MKKMTMAIAALAIIAACSTEPNSGKPQDESLRTPPTPTLAAAWAPKYPTVPFCTNGNSLPVNEIILHGEVWEGFASNGWIQYAKSPLESSAERTVAAEVYSFQGVNVNTRCRNTQKVLIWTFYDSPSQTPVHHLVSFNGTKQQATFSPAALTNPGDGNEVFNGAGMWEIGRDHYVVKAYPRALDNAGIALDTVRDTLAVDVMITYPLPLWEGGPGGCPPNQLQNPSCRP